MPSLPDDRIVVEGEGIMHERVSVIDYLAQPESLRPSELVYGVVREPPAPDRRAALGRAGPGGRGSFSRHGAA